jgi:hypothetical protein
VIDYRLARGESAAEWERFLADFAADLNDVIPSDLFVRHRAAGHNAIRVSGPDQKRALEVLGRPCRFLPSTSEAGAACEPLSIRLIFKLRHCRHCR